MAGYAEWQMHILLIDFALPLALSSHGTTSSLFSWTYFHGPRYVRPHGIHLHALHFKVPFFSSRAILSDLTDNDYCGSCILHVPLH